MLLWVINVLEGEIPLHIELKGFMPKSSFMDIFMIASSLTITSG